MPHNDFAKGVLSIIHGMKFELPSFDNTIDLKSEDLDKYVGVYSHPDFPLKLTVFKEGNVLLYQGTGQPSFPLECYEPNKFKFEQAGVKLDFRISEHIMLLEQGGNKIEMKKE